MADRNDSPPKPTSAFAPTSALNETSAPPLAPISNYTLASACPACDHPTIRRACKVRCERCGFMWDCSEL
ncbi:MAG: hypothetical protein MUF38_07015 [Anaerolineae bacterium]|nr:hypothetical protein [Anaerolineae bacterium]